MSDEITPRAGRIMRLAAQALAVRLAYGPTLIYQLEGAPRTPSQWRDDGFEVNEHLEGAPGLFAVYGGDLHDLLLGEAAS